MDSIKDKMVRAAYIAGRLEQLFPETPIPLFHQDAYTLLVAVLLSAQCTDIRVNQVTPHLFKWAANPYQMIELDISEIENIIRPCGLGPRKARAIWELSNILAHEYDGVVPCDMEKLESLPGVGHKTASVVMAQWFGVPMFPVDTHIHRLSQQWELTSGKNVVQTEKDLKEIFPQELWNKLHLQIIFYGREYCEARKCDGLHCELCQTCFPMRKTPKIYNKS